MIGNTLSRATVGGALVVCGCLAGCGGEPRDSSPPAASHSAAPLAETQLSFEEQRRRIEAERQRQAELEQRRRSFVSVEFVDFDDRGRIRVTLTNHSDRAIDDLRGGIYAEDRDGNTLATSGLTIAVPGDVFLGVGESRQHAPFLSPRPELAERLRQDPSSVVFSFSALALTWADGSTEPGLEK